jgi:hypothetical protein
MNSFFNNFRIAGWIGLLAIAVIFTGGCSSMDKPESASFASVVIVKESIPTIKQATMDVFQNNGYEFTGVQGNDLVFERDATRREQLSYAGFAGTQQGETVHMRVKVTITGKGAYAYRLSCKAYAVCNPGQGVFENSTALFGFQSGPYQKLLDKVATTAAKSDSTP